jgi:hypothetical protein
MTDNEGITEFIKMLLQIPDGFATLCVAVATLLAGSFVIIGAMVAWRSVQKQIASAEKIEKQRHDSEVFSIEGGFTAELMVYSRGIVEADPIWNQRALQSPQAAVMTQWPIFQDPLYFRANTGKIGLLRQQWIAMALIGFYANLLELNEQAKEAMSGRPTLNVTSQSIAARDSTSWHRACRKH